MKKSELPTTLGPLERAVLESLWQYRNAVSVRELHQQFGERLAYTTLMTTLDRLYKKGILRRVKAGRAFLYTPRVSASEYQRGLAQQVLDQLIGRESNGVEPLLACIVDVVSDRDREWLDELDRLVQEKRRTLAAKEV
ncbi:MAG: BlaI/MecI/CopY family transcriptional regulator [Acidobacteria bacterium]|nr:BlaI/MecI/CopY family transcriptional regulator [Acidobacteriota bacterium]